MKWCCAEFESHLLKENPSVGLVYYYRSRVGATVFVSNRDEGTTLSKPAFAIRFCPFWRARTCRNSSRCKYKGPEPCDPTYLNSLAFTPPAAGALAIGL